MMNGADAGVIDAAQYLRDLVGELREVASKNRLPTVAYYLGLAEAELRDLGATRHTNDRKAG